MCFEYCAADGGLFHLPMLIVYFLLACRSFPNKDGTIFKGMKEILVERGLWAQDYRAKCTAKHRKDLDDPSKCKDGDACCCENILQSQSDFKQQKSRIEEQIKHTKRHHTLMLPKCHPELNPIEQFWAYAKSYTRQHCSYSFADLKKTVPKSLNQVPIETVRRYYRRSSRFCRLYSLEIDAQPLPWRLREFAMRKYKGHRGVPDTIGKLVDEMTVDLNNTHQKLKQRHRHPSKNLSQIKQDKILKVETLLQELERVGHTLPHAQ